LNTGITSGGFGASSVLTVSQIFERVYQIQGQVNLHGRMGWKRGICRIHL